MRKTKGPKNEHAEGFFRFKVEKMGKTISDLRFECNALLSQYQMYFNAIILVIGLTIAITSYIITGTKSFDTSNTAALASIGSTSLGSIIGMVYCFHDAGLKTKDTKFLKKYAVYQKEETTDEKRYFIRYRATYIALLQITLKKQSIAVVFRICTFLFVIGFIFYIIDSQASVNYLILIALLYVLPIAYTIWDRMRFKRFKIIIGESKKDFFDAICNLFYEEGFENFENALLYTVEIARGKKYGKRRANYFVKTIKILISDDTFIKKLRRLIAINPFSQNSDKGKRRE